VAGADLDAAMWVRKDVGGGRSGIMVGAAPSSGDCACDRSGGAVEAGVMEVVLVSGLYCTFSPSSCTVLIKVPS
jgi:hypothetical protein